MDVLNFFTSILDKHTSNPDFKPFMGEERTLPIEPAPKPKEKRKPSYVRKPEQSPEETFRGEIPTNSLDKNLTPADMGSQSSTPPPGVKRISKKKIR